MINTPQWIRKPITDDRRVYDMKAILSEYGVNTVCEGALCPNLNECYSKGSAAFLILGDACTRSCGFCSVRKAAPVPVDQAEPERILEAARRLALRYIVITSVTRDDLPDGGAGQFARTIGVLKASSPKPVVEALVPDFNGGQGCVEKVIESGPDIFGHNIETVSRLYPIARRGSVYRRSINLLGLARRTSPRLLTKSGIMLGLGETGEEVVGTMRDLRGVGCDALTIGQYMRPGPEHLPVERFARPEEFEEYKSIGVGLGFKHVSSGPFARSSYLAEEVYRAAIKSVTTSQVLRHMSQEKVKSFNLWYGISRSEIPTTENRCKSLDDDVAYSPSDAARRLRRIRRRAPLRVPYVGGGGGGKLS